MQKILSNLIFAIIFQNGLMTTAYASDYQIIQSTNKQSKYITFNEPNPPPIHENNIVEWFYNSLNQHLTAFSEEETIETIKKSMRKWSDISGVKFVYKGKTTNNINNSADGIITIGYWSYNAYRADHGDSGAYASLTWANFKVTEGHMILNAGDNSNGTSTPNNLAELEGLITHEVGHLIAIDHSDDEESIMFADPYHSYRYQSVLRSDDIKAASTLYSLNPDDTLTVIRSNFDIVIQSATFQSSSGESSNIWAFLEYKGADANNNLIWALKNYGVNNNNTSKISTSVRSNLDIVIQSATFHSPNGDASNIWAILEFKGTDSANNLIWALKNYGSN